MILTSLIVHLITLSKSLFEDDHSVHAGSSMSHLTCPSFFFLLHVASFLAGSWLLISLPAWEAWPSLTPFPWADPISLRFQATPHSYVGHNVFFVPMPYVYVQDFCSNINLDSCVRIYVSPTYKPKSAVCISFSPVLVIRIPTSAFLFLQYLHAGFWRSPVHIIWILTSVFVFILH